MCSHFLGVCYLANTLFRHKKVLGVPCPHGCVALERGHLPAYTTNRKLISSLLKYTQIGQDTPER